jgi:hypothetical protein
MEESRFPKCADRSNDDEGHRECQPARDFSAPAHRFYNNKIRHKKNTIGRENITALGRDTLVTQKVSKQRLR